MEILADLSDSKNIGSVVKKIREKTVNWSNYRKYAFLEKFIGNIKLDQKEVKKFNKIAREYLYCDFTRLKKPWVKKILLVGEQRSGKSEMIKHLVKEVLRLYPKTTKIYIVASNSLKYNFNNLKPADVAIIITDDAVEHQGSGQFMSKESQALAAKYYKIAHWYKKVTGRSNTFIILFFATQRFKDLDIRYRNAHITIWKNVMSTPEENNFIRAILQKEDYMLLERATILRNFNLPDMGKYFAYFINDKYNGFSEFPESELEFDKIDVQFTKTGSAESDLMLQIFHIFRSFRKEYKIDILWEDVAEIVNWKGTLPALQAKFNRWCHKHLPSYSVQFNNVLKKDYYQQKLENRRTRKRRPRNINKEIEKATTDKIELKEEKIIKAIKVAIKEGKNEEEIKQALLYSLPYSKESLDAMRFMFEPVLEKYYKKAKSGSG